ncbi:HAD family hydrolase [Lacticaseibacillus thailandensis]|nr:HAD family phosphatase [Lacticaseibacillus thailandensis]
MKKAVIFDMDGVLVDSEQYYFDRRMHFFHKLGLEPQNVQLSDYLGLGDDEGWVQLFPDEAQRENAQAEFAKYEAKHPVNYAPLLNPGVKEVLEYLQINGYSIALASAGVTAHINRMLEQCQLKGYFDVVEYGEKLSHNKPDPEIYVNVAQKLNVQPEECVVLEDSVNGIQAAKRAHMETWALKPRKYVIDQTRADAILPDMDAVLTKLKGLTRNAK